MFCAKFIVYTFVLTVKGDIVKTAVFPRSQRTLHLNVIELQK